MSTSGAITSTITSLQYAVYKCLCYYDIFNYPLLAAEIEANLSVVAETNEVIQAIAELVEQGVIFTKTGYYFLSKDGDELIAKRIRNEARYQKHEKRIKRAGKWIARFPFVKGVAISGSCAKGIFPEDGDADFFIITAPNRVWICRSCLILYKKVFLFNSKKFFCVNYFIDENNLAIPDHNEFVAHEIRHLRPLVNSELHQRFLSNNEWTTKFLPNKKSYDTSLLSTSPKFRPLVYLMEVVLNGKLGAWLDNVLFRWTLQVWKRKFTDFNVDDFDLNLRSKKHVSKHHPRGFQNKVLTELRIKLQRLNVFVE